MEYKSHHCGQLRIEDVGKRVTLSGWLARRRDFGGLTFIDLRDRYGITQLAFNEEINAELLNQSRELGREFVLKVEGLVNERENKNKNIETGEIEIQVDQLTVLNPSKTPPFTIEDQTDGGEELRMQYRYLDIRRNVVKEKLYLRHQLAQLIRNFLSSNDFIEVETPVLIKSTPEGARDFIVPSRMNENQFYALPQSPQTFKQLLMVAGMDKYFQIVKCFRDEDLRADRQPEFTQIDCEMSFVNRDDVLNVFEEMIRKVFKELKNIVLPAFPLMTYEDAMYFYGNDKPDTRFEMNLTYLKGGREGKDVVSGRGFGIFDNAQAVVAINLTGGSKYTRKQIDALTDWVKRPQIGAKGLIYCRVGDETHKSSVDKFYGQDQLNEWVSVCEAKAEDLILMISGSLKDCQKQMSALRLHLAKQEELVQPGQFSPLWVVDFPLLEWDEESGRYHAMHHPFTSPIKEDEALLETSPEKVRANAYDMVINGVELGGGSIRIHNRALQSKMFDALGFTTEEAKAQFGFLMEAFEYGAPPHGGIAFGFDRMCALLGETESIRDYIAFPKNNLGRDVMINAPSPIDQDQLDELGLRLKNK